MPVASVRIVPVGDAHVIDFARDEQGGVNQDAVRTFFTTEFAARTKTMSRLVIDLSGVLSLDSACLGPLVQKLGTVKAAQGRLALTGVESPALKEIFALTRFDKVFPICPTRDAALLAVAG